MIGISPTTPTGFDGTLCGIADEGVGNFANAVSEEKDGSLLGVTCEQCRLIVEFCKRVR